MPTADPPVDRFRQLYAQYAGVIYSRCHLMLGDPALAQDATQEVFFRIHRSLDRIPEPRAVFTWLYRAATNHCLNEIRNGRIRPVPVAVLPERADHRAAEHRFSDQDLVTRMVRVLPEELATAGWLYHVDELDQSEIAEICGVSRRTVNGRLARFNQQARDFIQRSEHAVR
jgi:RNA polymerase sigma-70 factor, ECF subfamily